MATTTVAELVNRTRRFMKDWPDQDVITASVSSTATTLTVADATLYPKNFHLEIDNEIMTVSTTGLGTSVPVRRAALGSVAASHASQAVVLIQPHFELIEVIDALNYALQDSFPLLYKAVTDTSVTTTSGTFEYTIPNLDGAPIQYISMIELKPTGETDYRMVRDWTIKRGATPKLQFLWEPDSSAAVRIYGYSSFPDLAIGGSMDTQFPTRAVSTIVLGAASYLLASGEAGRVRADTGLVDQREQANRTGSALSVSNSLYQRFRSQLNNNLMPRLPIHLKPTF